MDALEKGRSEVLTAADYQTADMALDIRGEAPRGDLSLLRFLCAGPFQVLTAGHRGALSPTPIRGALAPTRPALHLRNQAIVISWSCATLIFHHNNNYVRVILYDHYSSQDIYNATKRQLGRRSLTMPALPRAQTPQ